MPTQHGVVTKVVEVRAYHLIRHICVAKHVKDLIGLGSKRSTMGLESEDALPRLDGGDGRTHLAHPCDVAIALQAGILAPRPQGLQARICGQFSARRNGSDDRLADDLVIRTNAKLRGSELQCSRGIEPQYLRLAGGGFGEHN